MKIKHHIINTLFKCKTPKSYLIIFLSLVSRQNNLGYAKEIHYTDIMKETGYSKYTFFKAIQYFETGRFIHVFHEKRNGMYDIYFHDNDFTDLKKGERYLNLNDKDFFDLKLKDMTGTQLKVFLKAKMENYTTEMKKTNYYTVEVKKFAELIQSKDVYHIKNSIKSLNDKLSKKIINISFGKDKRKLESQNIYMNVKKDTVKKYSYDLYKHFNQRLLSLCRKFKPINFNELNLHHVTELILQYHKKIKTNECFNSISGLITHFQDLNPKLIHKNLRKQFSLNN